MILLVEFNLDKWYDIASGISVLQNSWCNSIGGIQPSVKNLQNSCYVFIALL